jgi:hypothetical protein
MGNDNIRVPVNGPKNGNAGAVIVKPVGGNETRPRNVAVSSIIRANWELNASEAGFAPGASAGTIGKGC